VEASSIFDAVIDATDGSQTVVPFAMEFFDDIRAAKDDTGQALIRASFLESVSMDETSASTQTTTILLDRDIRMQSLPLSGQIHSSGPGLGLAS
jgi:hypothetical protein